jgi:hypothetical protein
MTVDRRPVASRRPKSVGDRGLLRVARHDSPGVLPPPTLEEEFLYRPGRTVRAIVVPGSSGLRATRRGLRADRRRRLG